MAGSQWESPDFEPSLPVSEKSNPLTRDLDRASPGRIVQMLQACDAQMFQEDSGGIYQRLLSEGVVKTVMEVAKRVEIILKGPEEGAIVLSGCGTSGRLAFLAASAFNRELRRLDRQPVYSYVIAGGDRALFTSQEAPEDDAGLGVAGLEKVCEGKKQVLFIGISCGLSAPFVAGQLDFCLRRPEVYTPVLIGFNPATQARSDPIPGCSFTFLSVVRRLQERAETRDAFLLNPAVGPEAVSGSSRMKGGSATKILLEAVLSAAHAAAFSHQPVTFEGVLQHMRTYEEAFQRTYTHSEEIAALVEAAGHSLRCGGTVCYLGWGSQALLGLIDASECNPTFGADYKDIRGFINGGYSSLNNNEGPLSDLGPEFLISHEDFLRLVLPGLTDRDTVVLLYSDADNLSQVVATARRVREKTRGVHAVWHHAEGNESEEQDAVHQLCLSTLSIAWPPHSSLHMQWELSTKLVLNAVSTGAHVLKGKVFRNYMVDVQVTNSKLYGRAARLLQILSGFPESRCEDALLKVIHRVDGVSGDIAVHTAAARSREKVVPLALLCLLTGCSLEEAESCLRRQPIVREAVEAFIQNK
ncbi:glucokinase regulatory protein [Salarias fasciatus]|uniref:glucokinase regulatory protein n=1 Tax=Salarias fasciatus TaxID=181472 RepID=UPI001176CF8B|nr:glucokinase regulatory protein [Salarias fasciatus]